ncbi:hypothetical protein FKP32DRAFT_1561581, partial [Trametes sanguinea]
LSPRTLLLLARTSHKVRDAVRDYMARAFDINATLTRFFHDPVGFRCIQARTGTLIAGSVALQFFDRTSCPSSDLDLHVYLDHRVEIGLWLSRMGYNFAPRRGQDSVFTVAASDPMLSRTLHRAMPGVYGVYTFSRDQPGHPRVHVIAAKSAPMEVILAAHSTCVMNVISYNKAYCLFPRATLEERRSLMTSVAVGTGRTDRAGFFTSSDTGHRLILSLPPEEVYMEPPSRSFPCGPRWIGDDSTWLILLDTEGILPPPPPNSVSSPRSHDPIVMTSFSMRYDDEEGATLHFYVVDSPAIRYAFVCGDEDTADYLAHILLAKTDEEEYRITSTPWVEWT